MRPAPQRPMSLRGNDRLGAAVLVVLIHIALGFGLLYGLAPRYLPHVETITRLVEVGLIPPPPPPEIPPPLKPRPTADARPAAAAPAPQAPQGGTAAPVRRAALPPPIVPIRPTAPAGGGVAGSGTGTSAGAGAGGGNGGDGAGSGDGDGGDGDDGGTGAEQVAGAITNRDYPPELRDADVGGRVGILFTISPAGRVSDCRVTRSSGVPQLDQLTCRLIRERFRYRPATDGRGNAVEDEVEGVHEWVPRR